jgi:hypothetical protein
MESAHVGDDLGRNNILAVSTSAEYSIDLEKRLVLVKFGKRVRSQDIGNYARHLKMNPLFQTTFSEIADLRDVEEMELQAEDFLELAEKIDPFSPTAKRAFVVQNTLQSHAARMHKILRFQRSIEIFESLEEAEAWVHTTPKT